MQLTPDDFKAKYEQKFADNEIQNIDEPMLRGFKDDIADSFAPVSAVSTSPVAPAVHFDPSTRLLTAEHPLGTSELEYAHNNGAYVPYEPVQVDDNGHPQGEWRFQVRATGGRNASAPTDSPLLNPKTQPVGLTAGLSISSATLTAGQSLNYSVLAGGGTKPYQHTITAKNLDTGTVSQLSTPTTAAYSGVWANVPAGRYELQDVLSDAAGSQQASLPRQVEVTVQVAAPVGPGPAITGFLPDTGAEGTPVTIYGTLFTGATDVSFNGTKANFHVINSTTISTVVPVGATKGLLAVSTDTVTGLSATPFTVGVTTTTPSNPTAALTAALAISVASITAGQPMTFTVTANGGTGPYVYSVIATNNATGATTVLGSSSAGSFTPQTANTSYNIDATVTDAAGKSAQATTRLLQVTAVADQPPVASAGADTTVTLPLPSGVQLIGTGTDPDPGDIITAYAWAPLAGPNTPILSTPNLQNTSVTNLVAGAYQFSLTVTDNHGVQSAKSYVMLYVNAAVGPTLGSPSPSSGAVGSLVTLTGTNLSNATGYSFNGVAGSAANISGNTATSITLVVPTGATSGSVTVTTAAGTASSSTGFTITTPTGGGTTPTISGFTPSTARVGETVTVYGTNFTGATSAKIGTATANYTVLSSTQLSLAVPAGATNGLLSVTTPGGTATSATSFTVNTTASTTLALNVFSPTAGVAGTQVTISGTAFGTATGSIAFNGLPATSIVSWSNTQVVAVAPGGNATGKITLTTAAGPSVTSANDFLLSDGSEFDNNTATYAQVAGPEYRGFIDPDPVYSVTAPAISQPGSSDNRVTPVYDAPFTVVGPSFGMSLPILNSFQVGGGTQNFVRGVYYLNTGEEIGFQFEGNTGLYRYYQKLPNGSGGFTESLFNVHTAAQFGGQNSGIPVAPPYNTFGFSFSDLSWCLWLEVNDGNNAGRFIWDHCGLDGKASYDFRLLSKLAQVVGVRVYIGSGGNQAGQTFDTGPLQYGYLQGVGSANYSPVSWGDGGAVQDGQRVLIGGSVAHAAAVPDGASGIHSAHAAIFDVDTVNFTVRQRTKFWFTRTLADGQTRAMGDNSIDVYQDPATGNWWGTASTWGTFLTAGEAPVEPIAYNLGVNLPSGAVCLPQGVKLNLPSPDGGFVEDTDVVKWNGFYWWAYATNKNQVFTIHLAKSTSLLGDQSKTVATQRWTLVASNAGSTAIQEGLKLVIVNGQLQILATYAPGGNVNSVTKVYDIGQTTAGVLTQTGTWTRQDFAESPSPTHPNLVAMQTPDGYTSYFWFAFDGEQWDNMPYSWGRYFRMLKATRRRAGHEFAQYAIPA